MYSRITGTGGYLPKKIMTNHDLEKIVDTSDQWIIERTGIHQRHIAEDETTSDLAFHASTQAIQAAQINPEEIDLIIVATTTPDIIFPSTACLLQAKLSIRNCPAFDVQAVCSGFVYALATADQFMRSGKYRHILVVGAEVNSKIINWQDRVTCVLFGDGAGAVVLSQSDKPGILSSHLHADGSYSDILCTPGSVKNGQIVGSPLIKMEGNTVFKHAVKILDQIVEETLQANQLQKSDINWLVPHQANIRIIQATAKKLGMDMQQVIVTLDKHANTSAASIPLALNVAVRDGRIKPGHHVLMEAIGGGLTWGSILIRW